MSELLQGVEISVVIVIALTGGLGGIVAWLYKRTASANQQAGTLRERVTALETWQTGHAQRHDGIDGYLSRIEKSVAAARQESNHQHQELQREVHAMMAKLAVLTDREDRRK